MNDKAPIELDVLFDDVNPLEVYGVGNEKLKLLKEAFPSLKFVARGNTLKILGEPEPLFALQHLLDSVIAEIRHYGGIDAKRIRALMASQEDDIPEVNPALRDMIVRGASGQAIVAKTPGQQAIVEAARTNDIVFALGPAGTGKTYTAVALAVDALRRRQVKKIILTRPAVEAGEQLGFLPGDLKDKIDPYLRPLYDSLGDMIAADKLRTYLEKNTIEIAPLAYMRGRTLNNAYIILDEAQNATKGQLKMFLTRMGTESKIIVTGDATQVDLPKRGMSGLLQASRILEGIQGIRFVRLTTRDVVRHPLVVKILTAYETDESEEEAQEAQKNAPPPKPLGACLVELETYIVWDAVPPNWQNRRDGWIAQAMHASLQPHALVPLLLELAERMKPEAMADFWEGQAKQWTAETQGSKTLQQVAERLAEFELAINAAAFAEGWSSRKPNWLRNLQLAR